MPAGSTGEDRPERLLVCVRPNPDSVRLIAAGARLADTLRARLVVAHVEAPAQPLSASEQRSLAAAFDLAEQLGGETAVLAGEDVGQAILAHARAHHIRTIVVGKPARPRWRELLGRSPVDAILRRSGEIDVFALSGEGEAPAPRARARPERRGRTHLLWPVAVAALSTLLCRALFPRFDRANLVMIYLLGVTVVAVRFGRWPAALAACLSVAAFDFFFVPPYMTFVVADTQYLVTFAVMLTVALVMSDLAVRLRAQAHGARERERRTRLLYATSRELSRSTEPEAVGRAATRHVAEAFEGEAAVFLPAPGDGLTAIGSDAAFAGEPGLAAAAASVFRQGRPATVGGAQGGAQAVVVPLTGGSGCLGALAVRPHPSLQPLPPDQLDLVDTFARLIAAPLERTSLAASAERARGEVEAERLRNTLLSSVSHDLRTPLAAITGAASCLLEAPREASAGQGDLVETIYEEATRLDRMVANLLDMTRVESGALRVNRQWHSVEELVGGALRATERSLDGRRLEVSLPPDLPLVAVDAIMIERVLVNLLDNAAKHTPPGSPVHISAAALPGGVQVEVADEGPGLAAGEEAHVFEKFARARHGRGGFGLGLAICRAVVAAHGGRIWAANTLPRGAAFRFTLPAGEAPPVVPAAEGGDEPLG